MELMELLEPGNILVPLEADSIEEAVVALVRRLAERGSIRDAAELEELVREGGLVDVAQVTDRVVLPHFRTGEVDRLVVALGVAARPLTAPAQGGRKGAEIVVLILAPRDASAMYLQAVSALARMLRDPHVVDRLAAAAGPEDVLSIPEVRALRIQPRLAIRDVMARDIVSVAPDTPVREAVNLLVRQGARAIPVVGEKGEVLGIVSNRDVMRALLPQVARGDESETGPVKDDVEPLKVRDVMSRAVLCVSEELGVMEVANMMINKDVEQVPVVSEGKLSGVLTRGDIIRTLFAR